MCLRHSNACIHFFSCVAKISSEEFRVTLIVEDRDYRYISKTLILTNVSNFLLCITLKRMFIPDP